MSTAAGIWDHSKQWSSEELEQTGQRMMEQMARYPKDRSGVWQQDRVWFGCHDQWVTPESVGQPMPYYDALRELAITGDVILDNREELLEQLGLLQQPELPDVLLLIHAYTKWGEQMPSRLNGDFAFMIWDGKQERLFGARDWSGNRTLYYANRQNQFYFASTMEALLHTGHVKRKLSTPWMAEFLTTVAMEESTDIHATVYEEIHQLPPAHKITVASGRCRIEQYGNLLPDGPLQLRSDGEYEEAFRELFARVVRSKVRTRHGVAATLSGGLDSGSVVSYAAPILSQQKKPLYTYSFVPIPGFKDWTSSRVMANERPYIEETVRHVRRVNEVHDHYMDFADRSPLSEVEHWLSLMEMPYKYFENSFWIRGIFEQAQQHGAGVLLTGARGNFTISWGPAIEYYGQMLRKFQWMRLYQELKLYSRNAGIRRKKLVQQIGQSAFPGLVRSSPDLGRPDALRWINPELAARTGMAERVRQAELDLIGSDTMTDEEVRNSKFANLAVANKDGAVTSKLSMGYGVWERDPTNDPRIVKFCLSIPFHQYVQNGMDRALIRRATEGQLPDKIRLNQKVRGLQPADWVLRMRPQWGAFTDEIRELCRDASVAQWVNTDNILSALQEVGDEPDAEAAFNPSTRLLMRSLIVGRFIRGLA